MRPGPFTHVLWIVLYIVLHISALTELTAHDIGIQFSYSIHHIRLQAT